MTCIFPQETPCGWHLIGRSPVPLWDKSRCDGAVAARRQGIFAPVSLREYEDLLAKAADGRLSIAPVDQVRDAAA